MNSTVLLALACSLAAPDSPRVSAEAFLVPEETYNEGSGYFSIVEGKDGRLYIGTAKYRENAYLVEFDPRSRRMRVVVDCMREIGSAATGFAAQSKIHTRRTLYAVAMESNALFAYDLAGEGLVLEGKRIGKLLADADATDCRAMCVGADGRVWAAVSDKTKERHDALHVVSWTPGAGAPKDHGLVTIRNPDFARIWNEEGKPLPHRHGMRKLHDGALTPLYPMGICAGRDGTAYVTVIMPLTLVAIPRAD